MPPTDRPDDLFEHADFLSRLARGLIADEHRAADVVQDTFVAALEQPPRDRAALGGWLAQVLRRRAANEHRGHERRSTREARSARPEQVESSDEVQARLEVQRLVFDHVLALPEAQRTALYLRYYEGLGPTAIAEKLGVPVKTVKTRLARGLTALRERLDTEHEGGRDGWVVALAPVAFPPSGGAPLPIEPGAATITGVLGGVAVKKLIAVGAAVVAAVAVWSAMAGKGAGPEASGAEQDAPAALVSLPEAQEPPPTAAPSPGAIAEPSVARRTLAPAGEAAPDRGALRVALTWHDGTPAEGIEVEVTCEGDPASRKQPIRGRTDGDGRARFAELHAGPLAVYVDRGYYESDAAVAVAGQTAEYLFELPRGEDVRGVVLDPDGHPVAGASLWLEGLRMQWPRGARVATTAADGSFHIRSVRDRGRFGARATGFQPSNLYSAGSLQKDVRGARGITIALGGPGSGIRGRVLDPAGEPVAGAEVHAGARGGHIIDEPSGIRSEAARPVPTLSDADGVFVLPGGYPAGDQPIHVMARGFPTWSGSVQVPERGEAALDVRLEAAARVSGRVLDADGNPVVGALVACARERDGGWYEHAFPPAHAASDADGRYEIDLVPPGAQELNAATKNARLGRVSLQLTVDAGSTLERDLVLDPNPLVAGVVVDAGGAPLAGWRVSCGPKGWHQYYPRRDETDDEGRFLLANVGPYELEVKVHAPGELRVPRAEAIVSPGEDDLTLVVEEAMLEMGHVSGYLVDADGSVPEDVELIIYPEAAQGTGYFVDFDPRSGEFRYETLVGGYWIGAWRHARTVVQSERFEVEANATTDVGLLEIAAGGRIELVVGGFPREAIQELYGHFQLHRGFSGAESFELEGDRLVSRELMPGTWVLTVSERELFLREEVEVVGGATEVVEVELRLAVPVPVFLTFPEEEWERLFVDVTDAGGAVLLDQSWPKERFDSKPRLELRLPAGPATLVVRTDTGRSAHATLDVGDPALARTPVQVALE